MQHLRRLVRVGMVALVTPCACNVGGDLDGPFFTVDHLTRSGTVQGHAWECGAEFAAGTGDVSADVAPPGLFVQIHLGHCSSVPNLVAESTTTLTSHLARGAYHVMVGNPAETAASFTITVKYLRQL